MAFVDASARQRYLEDAYVSQVTDSVSEFLDSHNNRTSLHPASDVTVNAVITSVYLNSIIFVVLMTTYECLRRKFPIIYNGRHHHVDSNRLLPFDIPTGFFPLQWMFAVIRVPWRNVLEACGLDAYMFLRYIRMCFRISFATGLWGMILLWPIFAAGGGGAEGWYHFSMANLNQGANALWYPTAFIWLFSFYVFYLMNNEYKHFLNLRMEFLGKGDPSAHPQHHYSILLEQVPVELRSDVALYEYFDSLFPGKVHSASVIMKLPNLEQLSTRRKRVLHRLEKSVASYEAVGTRPVHRVGKPRLMCCGIQTEPLDFCACCKSEEIFEGDDPPRGALVDSIKYYCNELRELNTELYTLQMKNSSISTSGNSTIRANEWIAKITNNMALWSKSGNALRGEEQNNKNSMKENPKKDKKNTKTYGSLNGLNSVDESGKTQPLLGNEYATNETQTKRRVIFNVPDTSHQALEASFVFNNKPLDTITECSDDTIDQLDEINHSNETVGKIIGLNFVKDSFHFFQSKAHSYLEQVIGSAMSSTGFVTFSDLASATCASSAHLTHKPDTLTLSIAPEPRDIQWENAHIDLESLKSRSSIASVLLGLGAILWSIPLTIIQAFATAESLASIPGLDWLLTIGGGNLKSFINGYLPVVALLVLIMLLPIVFERVSISYERIKTHSGVQNAILTRYFYYQLANIYISVTAGSLWNSLADILDHPSNVMSILGKSLPTIVGYFISLLVTKILAGLPMVLLRSGALARMVFLRTIFREKFLTQRELDEVYRPQHLLLGWEYPTQLLVIVICFTYACISPIILPFGAAYFGFALIIYKKQILYVYTPRYESGGESFPLVMHRTLVGLMGAQITFIGYITIRRGFYQPLAATPLLLITWYMMSDFTNRFKIPSQSLSMERAKFIDDELVMRQVTSNNDSFSTTDIAESFNKHAYRQPVLTEGIVEPLPYRHGSVDKLKEEVDRILQVESMRRIQGWGNRSQFERNSRVSAEHV